MFERFTGQEQVFDKEEIPFAFYTFYEPGTLYATEVNISSPESLSLHAIQILKDNGKEVYWAEDNFFWALAHGTSYNDAVDDYIAPAEGSAEQYKSAEDEEEIIDPFEGDEMFKEMWSYPQIDHDDEASEEMEQNDYWMCPHCQQTGIASEEMYACPNCGHDMCSDCLTKYKNKCPDCGSEMLPESEMNTAYEPQKTPQEIEDEKPFEGNPFEGEEMFKEREYPNPPGEELEASFGNEEEATVDQMHTREDNMYKHMNLVTRNNYAYPGYTFDVNRDPFEWELNSTKFMARAWFIEQRYSYEARFQLLISNGAMWPSDWRFLQGHNIKHVLRLSVNQLQSNTDYMRIMPDSTPLNTSSEPNVIKTMVKIMKSYFQVWGKSNFQIILMQTDDGRKVKFLNKLAKALSGVSGLSMYDKLAVEFIQNSPHASTNIKRYYVVLKNSGGMTIKENVEDKIHHDDPPTWEEAMEQEGTESGAFAATPESPYIAGKTGPEINRDAKAHLDQMMKGFSGTLKDSPGPTIVRKIKEHTDVRGISKNIKGTPLYFFVMENPTTEDLMKLQKNNADYCKLWGFKEHYDMRYIIDPFEKVIWVFSSELDHQLVCDEVGIPYEIEDGHMVEDESYIYGEAVYSPIDGKLHLYEAHSEYAFLDSLGSISFSALESGKLGEGKVRNLAAVLTMVSALATANPVMFQVEGPQWKAIPYDKKIEYVDGLYHIADMESLPAYVSITDVKGFSQHKVSPNLMVTELDGFYLSEEHKDVPVWLAMLVLEGKITEVQADMISQRLMQKRNEPEWVTESQIKVLQNYNRNHIDVIDVIARNEGEGMFKKLPSDIEYKDKKYKVFNHPKVGPCIAIS